MASPDSSDRSLLDRLNALKPTTISLDTKTAHGLAAATAAPSASAFTDAAGPTSVEGKQPLLSREDALAERLRVLRNNSQPEKNKPSDPNSPSANPNPPASSSSGTPAQPQCPATHPGDEILKDYSLQKSCSSLEPSQTELSNNRSFSVSEKPENQNDDDDYIHLLESGDPDQILDELLDGLDDEFDLDENEPPSILDFDPAKEARKVSDLLEQFQKDNESPSGGGGSVSTKKRDGHAVTARGKVSGEQPPRPPRRGDPDDDDDSESERMTREVEDVLSRIREELGAGSEKEAGEAGGGPTSEASPAPATSTSEEGNSGSKSPAAGTSSFFLPDAPASPLRDINLPKEEAQAGGERRKSSDFENDIVTRMASLKGLGSGINVDAFGLPVAPTFSPQDHLGPKDKKATKGVGRAGYTDEDQKTWCIVCLDDATIKCIGCDSDVFCGRCWRDMHVGPSAGYEERGHQWVKFVRGGG